MREGKGGGKEREAPTHLIKNSELTHAARVTQLHGVHTDTHTQYTFSLPLSSLSLSLSLSHRLAQPSLYYF